MPNLAQLTAKFQAVWPLLDERSRRLMAAGEATSLGRGGVSAVSRACGLSRRAVTKGIQEVRTRVVLAPGARSFAVMCMILSQIGKA